jgi:Flp pilus assembly protein TadG
MRRLFRDFKNSSNREKGQVMLIAMLAMIGLIAVIGLALDGGIMFVSYARLRRATDAAALAAALQYRQGYHQSDLYDTAMEFLALNGVNDPAATVDTCVTDSALCTTPPRKLVLVQTHGVVQLAFLPVIGIDTATLSASAESEAASVDVVLLIDTSESMTFNAAQITYNGDGSVATYDPNRDPTYCNPDNSCEPFAEVKSAAQAFADQMYYPFDRVSVINFDSSAHDDLDLTSDQGAVDSAIQNLQVVEGNGVCPSGQPCRNYLMKNGSLVLDAHGNPYFTGFGCGNPWTFGGDPSQCTTTNTGGGFLLAGDEFAIPPINTSGLWVVVFLTDGAANSGACPTSTWAWQDYVDSEDVDHPHTALFCRNVYDTPRHCTDTNLTQMARCESEGGVLDDADYNADDYARDEADFVAFDQHAYIYSIGLGNLVTNDTNGDPTAGQQLLQYAANAGSGEPIADDAGLYYFAPSGAQLASIFQAIANNIAIRLTK